MLFLLRQSYFTNSKISSAGRLGSIFMPSGKAKRWAVLWHATPDAVCVWATALTCGSQSSAIVAQSVSRGRDGTLTDSTLGRKGFAWLTDCAGWFLSTGHKLESSAKSECQ